MFSPEISLKPVGVMTVSVNGIVNDKIKGVGSESVKAINVCALIYLHVQSMEK